MGDAEDEEVSVLESRNNEHIERQSVQRNREMNAYKEII